jgi:hypothetical protein
MFAKFDKYGVTVTVVYRLSCKVKENIKVNYKTGDKHRVHALRRLGLLTK